MQHRDQKFSVLSYLQNQKPSKVQLQEVENNPHEAETKVTRDDLIFKKWVEEVRNELVRTKGKDQRESQFYNDMLNRAVLGFAEERSRLLAMIEDLVAKRSLLHLPPDPRLYDNLAEAIFSEIIGLNVLELVMKQRDGLEEIQVVGCDIFEVRYGQIKNSTFKFSSRKDVERIQQNLVLYNNDTLNPRKKWAEVILQDGSRVTMTGFGYTAEPTLTIRFYTMKTFDLPTLVHREIATIHPHMLILIRAWINAYFNLVIIGPTNSGKTNLIKAMIAEMNDQERIITIESRLELHLKRDFPQKNIIEYEVDEEDVRHSSKQAFKLALRQTPKRICHAEIRDEDANMYVRACTRGHEGSLTTLHANTLEDVPDAITDMCMLDGRGMDPHRLRKRITQYVTQIGFELALVGTQRKVVRIGEFSFEDGEVKVNDLALYDRTAKDWRFPGKLSTTATQRIAKHAPHLLAELQHIGLLVETGAFR